MSAETMPTATRTLEPPYLIATASVVAVDRVSPSFVRIGFGGDGIDRLGTPGSTFDQRIKLVFPGESGVPPRLAESDDWYRAWLDLPEQERGSMRTYSIRDLPPVAPDRPESTVLVVDFVLHLEPGLTGPASRWADAAAIGDELLVVGPRRGRVDTGGIEFAPGDAPAVLLAGDETAAPAIARILEDIDRDTVGIAFIEVPDAGDALPIDAPPGVEVRWLPRHGRAHGEALIPAVLGFLGADDGAPDGDEAEADGLDADALLWETPVYSGLGEALPTAVDHVDRYHWIAGESGVVTTLRRHLVHDLGIDRAQVAFMGYWRRGVAMKG
jgi:NADPH-dependent ferric siderophore reductase